MFREPTKSCPSGKSRFASRKAAKRGRKSAHYKHGMDRARIYRCPLCHGWHLTTSRLRGMKD